MGTDDVLNNCFREGYGMASLVLALAGLTAGSSPRDRTAAATLTVTFSGKWKGTIQDEGGTQELEWCDGEARWGVSRANVSRGTMQITPDGRGKVLVTWKGRAWWGWGRDKGTPIPWCEVYRGIYKVQGDRVLLRLGPTSPEAPSFLEAFVKPTRGPVRITLEPVRR